jgi:hypothetical protein
MIMDRSRDLTTEKISNSRELYGVHASLGVNGEDGYSSLRTRRRDRSEDD